VRQSPGPSYDLLVIQELVRRGDYLIRGTALAGATALLLDPQDIESCVLELEDADFYKTMPAHQIPGLMQDVYKPTYSGIHLYVKLQIGLTKKAVVISFKGDESI
jgi:hypothetical protein